MKKQTIDKYAEDYLANIQGAEPERQEALLRVLIKTVERDTRHAACDEINKLHNRVHNLDH